MKNAMSFAIVALASAVAATAWAASVEGDAKRLAESATVLKEIHAAPDKDIPQDLWEKAHCVAVIPSVKKAAFIVGGEYGKGVLSCRSGADWSAPSFVQLEKGSVGFQIGGESVDLVLLFMTDQSVNRLFESKVALGAETSIAGGPVGRDARAMTDAQLKAQILSYSRAQGLFAGIDLTGGVLKPDNSENKEFYGRGLSAREILKDHKVNPPASAQEFLSALRSTVPSRTQH
jgi:lipid-binding SYLF domain-containing protein